MSVSRYPTYRRCSAWFGSIPAHWHDLPLKYVVRLQGGVTPSKENIAYWDGDVPWASSKDLKSESISDTADPITNKAIADGVAVVINAGSVLVVVRGMILAHTFPVTRALRPMAINQDLKAVTPRPGLLEDFLPWLLRGMANVTLGQTDEAAHGTKVLRIPGWLSTSVPIPSEPEQLAIVGFLVGETAKIDALISEQRRLIDLLNEKRQAVIFHAVTKGLNPDAPMKPSGVESLGDVPGHWPIAPLRRWITRIEQGWSPQCENSPAVDGEWGVLKVGCVNSGVIDESEQKALPLTEQPVETYEVRPGDILLSRGNTLELVGSAAYVGQIRGRLMLSDLLYRFRARDTKSDGEFLALVLRSAIGRYAIERDATGTSASMKKISQSMIYGWRVPLPPLDEQREIVASVKAQLQSLDSMVLVCERAIELLQERRTALISAAVTGQIDVRGLAVVEVA